jgi:hypothetical protein
MIPTATATTGSGAIRAFTPGQIAMVTLFGSPIAGGIAMWLNHRRAGQAGAGAMALLVGVGATALLLVVGAALPDSMRSAVAPAGVIAMWQLAKARHGGLGPTVKASSWGAAALGAAMLVVVVVVTVGYIELAIPPSVSYGAHHEVQYTRRASEADAKIVGDYLRDAGLFAADHGVTVRVSHEHGALVVSFVMNDDAWDSAEVISEFTSLRAQLAPLFPSDKVVIALCDDGFDVHRTIE